MTIEEQINMDGDKAKAKMTRKICEGSELDLKCATLALAINLRLVNDPLQQAGFMIDGMKAAYELGKKNAGEQNKAE